MLQKFEKYQLVIKVRARPDEHTSYNWFLTPQGIKELETRLALLVKMLKASKGQRDIESKFNAQVGLSSEVLKYEW